jgi:hypothetical protein
VVLGCGDSIEAIEVVAAWSQWHRREREKFCQPDSVQVKILWLWSKDRAAGGFIGGQQ